MHNCGRRLFSLDQPWQNTRATWKHPQGHRDFLSSPDCDWMKEEMEECLNLGLKVGVGLGVGAELGGKKGWTVRTRKRSLSEETLCGDPNWHFVIVW